MFKEGSLALVELEMKADGIVNCGTDLDHLSIADVGSALGLHPVRVELPSHPGAGRLRTTSAHPGPAFVEVMTARQEFAIPPEISVGPADSRSGRPAASSEDRETTRLRWPVRTPGACAD